MSGKTVVKIPEAIIDGIRSASNVVLLTHVHPDGDALGSSLAFAEILEDLGKKTFFFMEEPVTYHFEFLPGTERIRTSTKELQSFIDGCKGDYLIIALDSGDFRRLGRHRDIVGDLKPFLVIDHHKSHQDYGQHRWVDAAMSSTGEMIYELAGQLGAEISYSAAVNLYVAITTDTGSFRYESTKPRTLQIAAELVSIGVRPYEVANCLYENVSLQQLNLLQRVLATMQLHTDQQLACIHVTEEMVAASGATMEDVEGFVDYPRSLSSVKVAAFFKQTSDDCIAVSLRAKGECDVAEVAGVFEGGGHRNAAGFRVCSDSLEDVRSRVLHELNRRLQVDVA